MNSLEKKVTLIVSAIIVVSGVAFSVPKLIKGEEKAIAIVPEVKKGESMKKSIVLDEEKNIDELKELVEKEYQMIKEKNDNIEKLELSIFSDEEKSKEYKGEYIEGLLHDVIILEEDNQIEATLKSYKNIDQAPGNGNNVEFTIDSLEDIDEKTVVFVTVSGDFEDGDIIVQSKAIVESIKKLNPEKNMENIILNIINQEKTEQEWEYNNEYEDIVTSIHKFSF